MDTLRLSSDFSKKIASSYISKLFKKNGYDLEFVLNAIEITEMTDGTYKAHFNGDLTISKDDITHFLHLSL